MGKRGPSKKPKEILKLSGGWRGKYRGDEPKAEIKKLRAPAWLDAGARRAWNKIVKQMTVMGILTMADENLVARYAETWARWRRAQQFIDKNGESGVVANANGEAVSSARRPESFVATQLLSELTKMEDRLGLSPGARAGLAVDKKELSHEPKTKARHFA